MNTEHCYYCNNTGQTKEDPYKCKYCGREYKRDSGTMIKSSSIYIPNEYNLQEWDSNKFISITATDPNPEILEHKRKWAEAMVKLLDIISKWELPKFTYYITAKRGSGITRWSYKVLSLIESLGYEVHTIIDINDINLEDEEFLYLLKDYKGLILRLTDYNLDTNIKKLNYIIPAREQLDLLTIIISVVPYEITTNRNGFQSYEKPIVLDKKF